MKTISRILAALALAGSAGAQTQVDLRTEAKNADFSAYPSTKSFQTGTSLPGTCSLGQTFFKSNAVAGANFYACTATNTWSLESGNATQLQSRNVAATAPTDGQALVWNNFASAWQPGLHDRRPEAIIAASAALARERLFHEWVQWLASVQWK